LKEACAGTDVVLMVAGLGGGAATGICPVLARAAHEAGALVLAFAAMPFDYEGNLRLNHARQGLGELKAAADGWCACRTISFSKLVDENCSCWTCSHEHEPGGGRGAGHLAAADAQGAHRDSF